ncbi:MAG: acyl-CoA dehydrogenase family protein, partial [Candidatus Hydrogenedentes bacterium]|nr:acyl-CoA dehydrogenase family protein [Candidatus Hydrogenedentota bacterium]
YVINGQKQWITNGGIADILTVMAQTEVDTPRGKEDRVTAFLVTPDMPGFKVTEVALEKVGMRGTKTAKLAFENLVVPEENILGPKGGGLKVALTVLNFGRTTFGAGCTGNCKDMTERAIAHAKTRHQFDKPLAAFGLIKEKIAKMAALTYAVDATTYLTAGLLDRGEEDFKLETAILKVFASEAQWLICYEAMQILGGRSFFTDQPFERYMRDARLNTIGEGANEVLRTFLIAAVGLGDIGLKVEGMLESKSKIGGLGKLLGFGASSIERMLKTPTVPAKSPELREQADQLASATRRFGIAVMRALGTHRKAVLDKQMMCNRIADCVIALYTATAVISKLDSGLTRVNGHAARVADDVAVGKLYCSMAFQKIDQSLATLFKNNDDVFEAVSDRLTGLK